MKLQDIVDSTVSLIGNEDDKIKIEVEQHIHNLRAKYLKQHFDRYGLSEWMVQTIILDMEVDSYSPACSVLSCKVNITTVEVPRVIRGLSYIVSTIGGGVVTETTLEKFQFEQFEKYTSKFMRYFFINNRLAIPNNLLIKQVKIKAPFEYPHLVDSGANCENCGLAPNEDYPIHIDYIPLIQMDIVNMYQRPQDKKLEEL
jgi:hypothetical protein